MAQEIERKFLLCDESWRSVAGTGTPYRQGYLSLDKERIVRVRVKGEEAFLTVKGGRKGFTSAEYEYPLPLADAEEMLRDLCIPPLIEKMRYEIVHEGLTWEVDEFFGDNAGLLVAEVELESEEQEVPLPSWVGKEVTEDRRYANASLVSHPFKAWNAR